MILQVLVAPLCLVLLCSLTLAAPLQVGDGALKAWAHGPSQLTLNYDGEPRKAVERGYKMLPAKLPKKRGAIVDGKLIPFNKL